MKCSKAHRLISEQIDGSLSAEQAKRLQDHLNVCQTCKTLSIEMKQVVEEAGALETVAPPANLWPVIKKQLKVQDRRPNLSKAMLEFFGRRLRHPVLAPTIACLAVILVAVIWFKPDDCWNRRQDSEIAMTSDRFKATEKHFLEVIDSLNSEIFDLHSQLNPQLVSVFKESLEIIDASIVSLRAAMHGHPAGSMAKTYLFTCYQRKIDVLNQIRNRINQPG